MSHLTTEGPPRPRGDNPPGPGLPEQSGIPIVDTLLRFPRQSRRFMVAAVNLLLAVVSSYLAFNLRFDGHIPLVPAKLFVATLPWLLLARGSIFYVFRLDVGLWRYVGLWDLRRIVVAVVTSTAVFFVCVRWIYGTDDYPRSILLIDSALLLILMGAFRLTPRLYREMARGHGEKRLLIVGAGDTGERVLRQIRQNPASPYEPIGFVDENRGIVGRQVHGVPVLGTPEDLGAIVARTGPQEVMLALPHADPALLRRIVRTLQPFNLPITTVVVKTAPGGVSVEQIRHLSIEDLLARPPVDLGVERVRELVAGKRVMVTGAGGSIGSELAVQIAALEPATLVLFERYENGLYAVANTLQDGSDAACVRTVVGDITDEARVNAVLCQYRPQIVFHAAAHKHVPLMELNPCEAVKNNVGGTRVLAEAAERHGVERFILISTDKAVNPTSVMGATKRVAELVLQSLSGRGPTRFVTVRFGNVLGSNGSVLLRFQDQIKAGGPVTVTDPQITRYFMLIPEAVELVLHAAAVGGGGDILVLDMGEQIRVLDLAQNLIRLSGFVPYKEIPITFTGLRPGEKLYEELSGRGELMEASAVNKILRITTKTPAEPGSFAASLPDLERSAVGGNVDEVICRLCALVPTFQPMPSRLTA